MSTSSSSHAKKKEEQRQISNEVFDQIDEDKSDSVCLAEMEAFVASNSKLWSFLSVHFVIPVEQCQEVATRVAMELATGRKGKSALKKEISRKQFHHFRKYYMEDPTGAREFFHHTIVETFDVNHDSLLDEEEFENLMDALYGASAHLIDDSSSELQGGLLYGSLKLPPRENFKKMIYDNCDKDKDGKLELIAILDFFKEYRKKQLKELRKKGVHTDDRKHAENLAVLRTSAAAQQIQEVEASKKGKRGWFDDVWDWLCEVLHS